jgi:hypothetical protein
MARTCEVCGSEATRTFEVTIDGNHHVFDTVECAIEVIAPRCQNCRSHILGHPVEAAGKTFCCAHCAHAAQSDDRVLVG